MKNIIYAALSLDGFIADARGGVDWLMSIPNPENSDYGFARFMDSIDAVLMGRRTFEAVLSFKAWPYEKPVYVLSETLQSLPAHLEGRASLISGPPRRIVEDLHARGLENLYIDGGRTIQGFLEADLIDEMVLTRVSRILGRGIPLFSPALPALDFKLVKTEKLNDYLVKNHYLRQREAGGIS